MDELILNLLSKTRMGENESKVYLAVLRLGQATASQVSAMTGIKRPTVYNILEDLMADKYVTMLTNSKINRYVATDPKSLSNELDSAARNFKEMLPFLQSIHHKAGKPIVSYYTGAEGAKIVFEQIKRPKEAYYATSVRKISKYIPQEVERWKTAYRKNLARRGGHHLLTDTAEDREYGKVLLKAGQEVHFLKSGVKLEMDLILYDGKVVIAAFDHEISVTLIESAALYHSLKTIYMMAWSSAKRK